MTANEMVPYVDKTELVHFDSQLDRFVEELHIKHNRLPAHIALAQTREDLSVSGRMIMLGTYETGEIVNMSRFIDKVVKVLGCTIFEHGAYKGQTDGLEHPGYSYLLIKTDKTVDREIIRNKHGRSEVVNIKVPVIIKVSGQFLDPFFLGMIMMDRAMDFKEPIEVLFSGSQSYGYHCGIVEDIELSHTIEEMSEASY